MHKNVKYDVINAQNAMREVWTYGVISNQSAFDKKTYLCIKKHTYA